MLAILSDFGIVSIKIGRWLSMSTLLLGIEELFSLEITI